MGQMPTLIYPDSSNEQLNTILVHPIPDNTDSQLDGLPGEDIIPNNFILVFPADTRLKSMYVVFTRPIGGDYRPTPK